MRNLEALTPRTICTNEIPGHIMHFMYNNENDYVIYYVANQKIGFKSKQQGVEFETNVKFDNIISAKYISEFSKVAICTHFSMVITDYESKTFYEYSFDNEVEACVWNENFDHFVVVMKNNVIQSFLLHVMSNQVELIQQGTGNLHESVVQPESVGWGSSSTQFQGLKSSEQQKSEEVHLAPEDNKKPVICWSSNANNFLVSYINDNNREFKVFNLQCSPQSKSEQHPGYMYGAIVWKPGSTVILASVYSDNKNYIGYFEKNGLFRKLIPLVDINYPICHLSWCQSANIIQVIQKDKEGFYHVCIYTISNYKWFLKLHLPYTDKYPFLHSTWFPSTQNLAKLQIVTENMLFEHTFRFVCNHDAENEKISVINGRNLAMYHLTENIERPVSSFTFSNPINMVAFDRHGKSFAVLTSEHEFHLYRLIEKNGTYEEFLTFSHNKSDFPLVINNLSIHANSITGVIYTSQTWNLFEYDFQEKKMQFKSLDCVEDVRNLQYLYDHRSITNSPLNSSYDISCPLEVVPTISHVFSISMNKDFYVDGTLIAKNITSMILHKDVLILTDDKNMYAKGVISEDLDKCFLNGLNTFYSRPLNESMGLLCTVGDTTDVLLQTPRGNLEIISCKPLELRSMVRMIKNGKKDWLKLLRFMKLKKLNWNLLIDLDDDIFYENFSDIIDACVKENVLNNVISEINDENALLTIYKDAVVDVKPHTLKGKRNQFQDRLIAYIDSTNRFYDYLPILMKMYLDKNDLKSALHCVGLVLEHNELIERAREALALLRIHIEPEDLLKESLQIYNLHLASFVVDNCQMNPQEYRPYIAELRGMNEIERRICINVKYDNWEKAVLYMLNLPNPDEAELARLIKEHALENVIFFELLHLKEPFTQLRRQVTKLFATNLAERGAHHEAALILLTSSMFDEAVFEFKLARDYEKCIEYLPKASFYSQEDVVRSFLIDLAEKLLSSGKTVEAAAIYENHLREYDLAVKTLANGKLFKEAMMLAKRCKLFDALGKYLVDKIVNEISILFNTIEEAGANFVVHVDRLLDLRNEKKEKIEQPCAAEIIDCAPECDVRSVISSTGSYRTTSSLNSATSSVKRMRKLQKQKESLKHGSRFEDIALIRELHLLTTKIFNLGPEIQKIFLLLIECDITFTFTLKYKYDKLRQLQKRIQNECQKIWCSEFSEHSNVLHISENFQYIDEQYKTIPTAIEKLSDSWKIDILEK